MTNPNSDQSGKVTKKNNNNQDPEVEERLDEALDESFPASDPPSITRSGAEHERAPHDDEKKEPVTKK